jgi:4-hydroxy-tetrahydrodipicolinate synthase
MTGNAAGNEQTGALATGRPLAGVPGEVLSGVLAAVLTPQTADYAPDCAALVRHCRWLLANGCDGLSVLGTTGEANSFSVVERLGALDALAEAGIAGAALLPGTGCCALTDAVALTAKAVEIGAAGALMLPPFYYKGASEDGLFAFYAEVIERVGDARLRIYLYHFPQMSGVPLPLPLLERLHGRYPETVVGMKDSSGDLDNMVRNTRALTGFCVFSGSDEFLLPLLRAGGAGCITAVSNVAAPIAANVRDHWRAQDEPGAIRHQALLDGVRKAIVAYPLTAALKALMARHTGEPGWRMIRPPLLPLPAHDAQALQAALERLGFRMPTNDA